MSRGALIFILAGAVVGIVLIGANYFLGWKQYQRNQKEKENDQRRRESNHKRYANVHQSNARALSARIDAMTDQIRSYQYQDHAHDEGRQFRERLTIWILFVTFIAAVVAAGFAGWAALTFQNQLEEARDEQRPWVYATSVGVYGPITHDTEGLHVSLIFTIKNIGKLPALRVFPGFWMSLHGESPADVAATCKIAEEWGPSYTVFPNDSVTTSIKRVTPQVEIDKAESDARKWGYTIFPTVLACIAYRIPSENRRLRHTPYSFSLEMTDQNAASGCCNVPLNLPVLPPGAVTLTPDPIGRLMTPD